VKPPPFGYTAAADLDEALEALAATGGKVLAGGQSLIPLLNMRLADPGHLVDINRIPAIDTVAAQADGVRVGALARHFQALESDEAAAVQPLLRQALRHVAHPAIRNRGTVVGSIVHADPAAELPAVLALTGGTVTLQGREGERALSAEEFFLGPMESAIGPAEIASEVFFPALPARSGTAFCELARRKGDFAMAGAAALVTLDADLACTAARLVCVGTGAVPEVIDLSGLCRGWLSTSDWSAAAEAVRERIEPEDDIHATADYRRHLAGVLAARALSEAAANAEARA
jgi:carbon-monoxide dehydrogenase medium subunit